MRKAILINDTSQECHIGCVSVINTIERLCNENNIQLIEKFTRHDISDRTRPGCLNKRIHNSDIIIINGEGSLHHHPRRNTKWFPIILKMIPKDKKVILINTIWQDMKELKEDIKLLDKLSLISVRESYSYNDLISIYPKKEKIIITPDILFATKVDNKMIKIGYGDSVHRELRQGLGKKTIFFPLAYIHKGTYRNIEQIVIPTLYSYQMWLKSLELYVTGRFHGVCLAAMSNIPFLALSSNSHKIEAILNDMDCSELLIYSVDEIKEKKEIAIKLIPKAYAYAIEAKKKVEKLFQRIAKL